MAGVIIVAKEPNEWETALIYSLEGIVGERLTGKLKELCKYANSSWKKQKAKLKKEEINNISTAREINSHQQQEITNDSQHMKPINYRKLLLRN